MNKSIHFWKALKTLQSSGLIAVCLDQDYYVEIVDSAVLIKHQITHKPFMGSVMTNDTFIIHSRRGWLNERHT